MLECMILLVDLIFWFLIENISKFANLQSGVFRKIWFR